MIDYIAPTLETGCSVLWPPCWCPTRDMRLIRVDGINRGTIWDGQASSTDLLGITPPVAGLAVTTPAGGGSLTGTYYCAIRYKDATHGTYSSLSALVEVTATEGDYFSWNTIPVSPEARVTHIELWRTTADQSEKLYLITAVENTGTSTYTLDVQDDDTLGVKAISEQLKIYNADGRTLQARRQGLPPNFMRVAVAFQDRTFYAVPAVYQEGSASVPATGEVPTVDTYRLSGTGVSDVDLGLYEEDGTYNGCPAFTHVGGSSFLWAVVADWNVDVAYWFVTGTKGSHNVVDSVVSGSGAYHMNLGFADPDSGGMPSLFNPYNGATGIIYCESYTGGAGGSSTFTGTGTGWTEAMEGREIFALNAPKGLTIQSVDEEAQTLDTTEAYTGDALAGVSYAIMASPGEYNNIIVFSEQDEPESVPIDQNQFQVQENTADDHDNLTGLMPHGAIMWGLKNRHTYRITFVRQPQIDVQCSLAFSRGCLNQRCWCYYEDTAFLMDGMGPWAIGPDQSFNDIADMKVKNWWRDGALDFGKATWWFVSVDKVAGIVRFHVTLNGQTGVRPKTVLCFSIRRQSWWVEPYVEAMSGACQVTQLETPRLLLAGSGGRMLMVGEGWSDGCAVAGMATAGASSALVDGSGRLPFTADMVGFDIQIVRGRGAGQVRVISAVGNPPEGYESSAVVTVTEAWETNPNSTSGYVVRYAVRSTCSSTGVAAGFYDTAGEFGPQIVGASVAIVEGTGVGQVRQITDYTAGGTFVVSPAWDTIPDATSDYLIGGIKCKFLSGLFGIPLSDPHGPSQYQRIEERAVVLNWTPTENENKLEVRIYPDHDTTPEVAAIAFSDGPLLQALGATYDTINLQRSRSSLADESGWEAITFRLRAMARVPSRHWFATEMQWYQGEERVQIHSLGLEGSA